MSVCFILIKKATDTFEMNPLIPEEKREREKREICGGE
jgi:hypothetical protein